MFIPSFGLVSFSDISNEVLVQNFQTVRLKPIFLFFSYSLSFQVDAVTSRRGLFGACIRAMLNPAGAISTVADVRSEFSGELEEVAKQHGHLNVLRLGGASIIHPWSTSVEHLAASEDASSTLNLYSLARNSEGKTFYRPLIKNNPLEELNKFHVIFDPGNGFLANLKNFPEGLRKATQLLEKGGLLAVSFPMGKNLFTQFSNDVMQPIMDAFSLDFLNTRMRVRYNFIQQRRSTLFITDKPEHVRLDGCFVRLEDGRFMELAEWIELRHSDFELVKPAFYSFNQLILKRKDFTSTRSTHTIRYMGSFGSASSPLLIATPFHFFDEISYTAPKNEARTFSELALAVQERERNGFSQFIEPSPLSEPVLMNE